MTPPKKTFIIRKPRGPLNPQFATRRLADSVEEDTGNHGCLCFCLGFLLGPLGLLIAAIIAKAKGLIAALRGLAVAWLIGFLLTGGAFLLQRL